MTCVRCGQPASVTMLNLSVDEPEKPLRGPCGRREAEGWKQGSLLLDLHPVRRTTTVRTELV